MTPPPSCLILGATGFIGGQIARAALAAGWRVRALRRRPDATGDIGDLAVEWVQGDLADRASLAAAAVALREMGSSVVWPAASLLGRPSSVDDLSPSVLRRPPPVVLFHCAGAYPHNQRTMARDVEAARTQMRNVLELAAEAGVSRVIYTSSFTTIGAPADPGRLADERDFYAPGSSGDPYYEAKWAMETAALEAAQAGLPVIVLCPTAVFGPGDVHLSVSQPLLMAAQGRMPFYVDANLSVVDVRDVAAAHLAAAERGRIGERYILNAYNLTLREGLAQIAAVAGARPPRFRMRGRLLDVVLAVGGAVPGSNVGYLRTMRLWRPVSNAKAVAELGLSTRPFAETVADSLAWFRVRKL
jgi:dihydroflavonol-4-reductase